MTDFAFAEGWRKVAASRAWASLDSKTQKLYREFAANPSLVDPAQVHALPAGTSCGMCFRHSEDHSQAQWGECFKTFLAHIPEKLEIKVKPTKAEAEEIRWRAQGYSDTEIEEARASNFHPWYIREGARRVKEQREKAVANVAKGERLNPYAVEKPTPPKPTNPTWFRPE